MSSPTFTKNAVNLLRENNLTENDVLDVFNHGEYKKSSTGANIAVKKYQSYGYEIGLYYKMDKSGGYIITFVWKRERR